MPHHDVGRKSGGVFDGSDSSDLILVNASSLFVAQSNSNLVWDLVKQSNSVDEFCERGKISGLDPIAHRIFQPKDGKTLYLDLHGKGGVAMKLAVASKGIIPVQARRIRSRGSLESSVLSVNSVEISC